MIHCIAVCPLIHLATWLLLQPWSYSSLIPSTTSISSLSAIPMALSMQGFPTPSPVWAQSKPHISVEAQSATYLCPVGENAPCITCTWPRTPVSIPAVQIPLLPLLLPPSFSLVGSITVSCHWVVLNGFPLFPIYSGWGPGWAGVGQCSQHVLMLWALLWLNGSHTCHCFTWSVFTRSSSKKCGQAQYNLWDLAAQKALQPLSSSCPSSLFYSERLRCGASTSMSAWTLRRCALETVDTAHKLFGKLT